MTEEDAIQHLFSITPREKALERKQIQEGNQLSFYTTNGRDVRGCVTIRNCQFEICTDVVI